MEPRDETTLAAWLACLRATAGHPTLLRRLRDAHGDLAAALASGPAGWRAAAMPDDVVAALECPDRRRLAADRAWLDGDAHHLVTDDDERYPPQLAEIADAPAALFVAGDPWLLWRAQLAIVGARAASAGGIAKARAVADAVTRAGVVVTSGLARGIDGAAHAAALDADGPTLAVCGTGPDVIYPGAHVALAARIVARGALVSEFPPGTAGTAYHFPRRNRIIAGLSLGTLVIEAGLQSGSLITARLAAEQAREVFALPGSIHHPLAAGCHRLLRDGARLVDRPDEVLEALAPAARRQGHAIALALAGSSTAPSADAPAASDATRDRVLAALGWDPVAAEEIVIRSELTPAVVSSMLLALELEGVVAAGLDGRYARVGHAAGRSRSRRDGVAR